MPRRFFARRGAKVVLAARTVEPDNVLPGTLGETLKQLEEMGAEAIAVQTDLAKEEDLKNTTYVFTLEDGSEVAVKGDEEIEYDGERHSAANLFDALKEGYYGKL